MTINYFLEQMGVNSQESPTQIQNIEPIKLNLKIYQKLIDDPNEEIPLLNEYEDEEFLVEIKLEYNRNQSQDLDIPQEWYEIQDFKILMNKIHDYIILQFISLTANEDSRLRVDFYHIQKNIVYRTSYTPNSYSSNSLFNFTQQILKYPINKKKKNQKFIRKIKFIQENQNLSLDYNIKTNLEKLLSEYLLHRYYKTFRALNEEYPEYLIKRFQPFDTFLQAEYLAFTKDDYKPKAKFEKITIQRDSSQDNNSKSTLKKKSEVSEISSENKNFENSIARIWFEGDLPRILRENGNKIQIVDKLNLYSKSSIDEKENLQKIKSKKKKSQKISEYLEIEDYDEDQAFGSCLIFSNSNNIKKIEKISHEIKGGWILLSENLTIHRRKKRAIELLKSPLLTPLQNLVDQIVRPDVFTPIISEKIISINSQISPNNNQTRKQYEAICLAYTNPDVSLIQGPPGSGKTTLIVELVQHFCRMGLRVLMVAPTHVAVDNIMERLIELQNLGVQMVRIGRPDRITNRKLEKYLLSNIRRSWTDFIQKDIYRQYNFEEIENKSRISTKNSSKRTKNKLSNLSAIQIQFFKDLNKERFIIDDTIINSCNLVCGTSSGVVSIYRDDRNIQDFDVMIIDESSKATVLEFLIPATRAKKWIIIGDQNQLPPYFDDREIRITMQNRFSDLKDDLIARLNKYAKQKLRRNRKIRDLSHISAAEEIKVSPFVDYLMQKFKMVYEGEHYVGNVKFSKREWEEIYKAVEYNRKMIKDLHEFITILGSIYHYFFNSIEKSRKIQLDFQYRMPPIVNNFLKNAVYQGNLNTADLAKTHGLKIDKNLFFNDEENHFPLMTFLSTSKFPNEERFESSKKNSTSKVNFTESLIVIQVLKQIYESIQKKGIDNLWLFPNVERLQFSQRKPLTIGVITFYGSQFQDIRRKIGNLEFIIQKGRIYKFKGIPVEIKISIVDRFQGQEKDIIIIPMTRSNTRNIVGFLKSIQRINVAFSREIHNLFIIGDSIFFEKLPSHKPENTIFLELIKYLKENNLLFMLNYQNFIENFPNQKKLRPKMVIIDGANVARYRTKSHHAKLIDIKNMEKYCQEKGYEIEVIFSDAIKTNFSNITEYEEYCKQKFVYVAPKNEYDDGYIIKRAIEKNAYIISNDRFSDGIFKKWRKKISQLRLGYIIFQDGMVEIADLFPINPNFLERKPKIGLSYKTVYIHAHSLIEAVQEKFPYSSRRKIINYNQFSRKALRKIFKNIAKLLNNSNLKIILIGTGILNLIENICKQTINDFNIKLNKIEKLNNIQKKIQNTGYLLASKETLDNFYSRMKPNQKLFLKLQDDLSVKIFQDKKSIIYELKH
jgi:tRNA A37 threonylcarbamoyladenosine biosynthesis protein TsaE